VSWRRQTSTARKEAPHESGAPETCPGGVVAHNLRPPVVRWVLKQRPTTERSSVSEADALRQAREEIAQLEAERVRLSAEVMEGRPGALEEDEQLRQRIAELGHWLLEAEKEHHVSETPSYEDVLHALRVRLAGSPQLRNQPAEDIGHDLVTNGHLSTEPDPALVRRALTEIGDEGGAP
jgi:hypothetical protein